jgi:hypothetical protein
LDKLKSFAKPMNNSMTKILTQMRIPDSDHLSDAAESFPESIHSKPDASKMFGRKEIDCFHCLLFPFPGSGQKQSDRDPPFPAKRSDRVDVWSTSCDIEFRVVFDVSLGKKSGKK